MHSQCFETSFVRPAGGEYVPPPFTPIQTTGTAVSCLGRRYDLSGIVPQPLLGARAVIESAQWAIDGASLAPPRPRWALRTPAVAIAERAWVHKGLRVSLRQTVEYDGFITCDLTLAPGGETAAVREVTLLLRYRPDASTLYHIPLFRPTWAGLWPKDKTIERPFVGVWGGDERAGLASYVASFRNWWPAAPRASVSKGDDGAGCVRYPMVTEPLTLRGPITFRFGFIATPVTRPETRHWQLYGSTSRASFIDRVVVWGGMSDHYATFSTNDPAKHGIKRKLVKEIHDEGKLALAYTTYGHVEEKVIDVSSEWWLAPKNGQIYAHPIGGGAGELKRVFLCPGSRAWIDWKIRDLRFAIEQYGLDGFYVDTSYIILPCANAEHDHGWVGAAGKRQYDYPTWSMREVWRRSYEMLCRLKGRAAIYAHHKGGCPAALAAFTGGFCDGEQYTSQPITNLTLDAYRAQCTGRTVGPLGVLLNEYYRSKLFGRHRQAKHHNPTESLMLSLPNDSLTVGYPGFHPVRELIALRDDLGIADAQWTPYSDPGNPWRIQGAADAVVSSYLTARGDTLLVAANPTYEPMQGALVGPASRQAGRAFVAIDVWARLGRSTPDTPGYRWEEARPDAVRIAPRSLSLYAVVRAPETIPAFAKQQGFVAAKGEARQKSLPDGSVLISDFDDHDWVFVHDDGEIATTDREPVDTRLALRLLPRPRHNAAALMKHFPGSTDWTDYAALTFWLRPDQPLPVATLTVRLRNSHRWGPALELVSHDKTATLPAGRWTQLRYEFRTAPRDVVQTLRLYYNRGKGVTGALDLDEVLLFRAAAKASAPASERYETDRRAVPD